MLASGGAVALATPYTALVITCIVGALGTVARRFLAERTLCGTPPGRSRLHRQLRGLHPSLPVTTAGDLIPADVDRMGGQQRH